MTAEQAAVDRGMHMGVQKGMDMGVEKGVQKVVLGMLSVGIFSKEDIAKVSGLSIQEINKLAAQQSELIVD